MINIRFFKFVKSGLLLKFGGRESFVSIVYIDDLVDGIVRAAFQEVGIGETFFVNTQDELSQWQAQYMMAEAMNRLSYQFLSSTRFTGDQD